MLRYFTYIVENQWLCKCSNFLTNPARLWPGDGVNEIRNPVHPLLSCCPTTILAAEHKMPDYPEKKSGQLHITLGTPPHPV